MEDKKEEIKKSLLPQDEEAKIDGEEEVQTVRSSFVIFALLAGVCLGINRFLLSRQTCCIVALFSLFYGAFTSSSP